MAKSLTPPDTLEKADKSFLRTLITATEQVFPKDLGLEGEANKPLNEWYKTPDGLYQWKVRDLLTYVTDLTDTNDIRSANRVLYQTLSKAPEYTAPTYTGAPEPEAKANIPGKATREEQEVELERREKETFESKQKGTEQTREFVEQQEKIIERLKQRKIKVVPKEEIPVVELNQKEKEILHNVAMAVKEDPGTAQKIFEEKIKKSLAKSPKEIQDAFPNKIIVKAAVNLVEKAQPFGKFATIAATPSKIPTINPASPIAAVSILNNAKLKGLISDEQERKILVETAQNLSVAIDNERAINVTLISQILPQNVAYALYGPPQITEFEIADDQSENNQEGIELDVREIYDRGKEIRGIWQKFAGRELSATQIVDSTSTFVSSYPISANPTISARASSLLSGVLTVGGGVVGFQQGILLSTWTRNGTPLLMNPQIAGLITSGGLSKSAALSSIVSSKSFTFIPISGRFSFGILTGTAENGTKLFAAGIKLGSKTSAIAIASTETGVKVATTGIFSKIAAALGVGGGPIGMAVGATIGWVAGKVIEKIPWHKIKKLIDDFKDFFIGGAFALVGLGLGGATGALWGGIGGFLGSKVILSSPAERAVFGRGLGNFFGALGSAILVSIGTPILVTLLVFPVVIALILFIINSGAYIVPQGPLSLNAGQTVISPYIDVQKVANPPGPFQNSNLPLTVQYQITIRSKKGPLTNVSFTSTCSATKKNGSGNCPQETNIKAGPEGGLKDVGSFPPPAPTTITPDTAYIITYNQTYDAANFQDSFITDTFSVKGDSTEKKGAEAAASAGIKIGNPPDTCPSGWPVAGRRMITQTPGGSYSHTNIEAMDIGSLPIGTPVHSTTSGTATVVYTSGPYRPVYVDVSSVCAGKQIRVRYAHFSAVAIKTGQQVVMGQLLGASGTEGSGPHLHYEFMGIRMDIPYIPKSIPRGCSNDTGLCGYIP